MSAPDRARRAETTRELAALLDELAALPDEALDLRMLQPVVRRCRECHHAYVDADRHRRACQGIAGRESA